MQDHYRQDLFEELMVLKLISSSLAALNVFGLVAKLLVRHFDCVGVSSHVLHHFGSN